MGDDDATQRRWKGPHALLVLAVLLAVALASVVGRLPWLPLHRVVILAAATSGVLFVVAGCYRLAKWQLRHDAHSGLAGSALLLVGAVVVPSRSLVEAVTGDAEGSLAAVTLRGAGSLIAMGLLLRALRTPQLRRLEAPQRLVPLLLLGSGLVFLVTVTVEYALLDPGSVGRMHLVVLSLAVAAAWSALALVMRRHTGSAPWAGRVSPLLVGMAVAELLRATGGEAPGVWTLAALLLTGCVALLALRSATADLGHATGTTHVVEAHLAEQLHVAAAEIEDHEEWRRVLRHESRNTCAGLRAAITMFSTPDGGLRPEVAGRLREAAVAELLELEQMLDPRPTVAASFDVRAAALEAVAPLRALGLPVRLQGAVGRAHGDPADVSLAVRDVLIQLIARFPGQPVDVHLTTDDGVLLTVRPRVVAMVAPPLDLHAVTHLLRRPGGDVAVEPDGTTVVLRFRPARTDQPVPAPS